MKRTSSFITILNLLLLITHSYNLKAYNSHPPKLTIVLVVDQFAHHYINKLYPHLKGGLKYLLDNGVVYTNAHMPHGWPTTATGHAALNTGTYAKDHGFIGNSWVGMQGEKIASDDDNRPESYVLNPNDSEHPYSYGKSSHQLMVDGLTDQCVMQSQPNSIFRSFSISGKSRSAIATASKLGKALWFDPETGSFTSSKAYFDQLPEWLNQFNQANNLNNLETVTWNLLYPKSPFAYNFFNTETYHYSRPQVTMLNKPLSVPERGSRRKPYHLFERTPYANKRILDLSLTCINKHVNKKTKDRLLLWICLSPLDKLTHEYGPQSIETIDMIYHLDKQLKKFIRKTLRAVGKHNVALVLTADHGIMPIPEIVKEQGLHSAQRISQEEFVTEMNNHLKERFALDNFIRDYTGQGLIVDQSQANTMQPDKPLTHDIMHYIKQYLHKKPYIKNAWFIDELMQQPTEPGSLENNIKNQIFKGRTAPFIIQQYPYTLSSELPLGVSHKSPYDYDTHVPLVIFHPGKFVRKYVRQRVTTLQVANTLAELLNIPKPSASTAEVLPELFDPEYQ